MARKPYKPSLAAICAVSGVGLTVRLAPGGGKETTRRSFSERDLKTVLPTAADRKEAPKLIDRLRGRKIIQGSAAGPFALTDHGAKVVNRACALFAKRYGRR
jgi:hypothetical protein